MRKSLIILIACSTLFIGCKSNKTAPESTNSEHATKQPHGEKDEQEPPLSPEPPRSLESGIWTHANPNDLPDLEKAINPSKCEVWQCNYKALWIELSRVASNEYVQIMLPTKNGLQLFNLENSGVMAPELAAKFPEIKSYKGSSSDQGTSARVDTNEKGLFAEFKNGNDIILLAPYFQGSKTIYTAYNKEDLPKIPRDENFEK